MCLHISYVCSSCRTPVEDQGMGSGEACQLAMTRGQLDMNDFNSQHEELMFHVTIPLNKADSKATTHVCRTRGCAYHPETEFTEGFHPDFSTMARCPGCDNIFSVSVVTDELDDQIFSLATSELDDQMIGELQKVLCHRADARVPILANYLWPQYHCTAVNNGCLWAGDLLSHVTQRLENIRECMRLTQPNVLSHIPLLQQLYAYEKGQNRDVEGSAPSATRSGLPWSNEEEDTLLRMKGENVLERDIALALKKTQKAVNSKLNNLRKAEEKLEASRSRQ